MASSQSIRVASSSFRIFYRSRFFLTMANCLQQKYNNIHIDIDILRHEVD